MNGSPRTIRDPAAAVQPRVPAAGESFAAVVWKQFVKKPHAVVGLFFIIFWFLVAIFAPFLASNRPLVYWENGETRWPLMAYLDFWDWVNLAGFGGAIAGLVLWRMLRRRRRLRRVSGRAGLAAAVGIVLLGASAALPLVVHPRQDPGDPGKYRQAVADGRAGAVFCPVRFAPNEVNGFLRFRRWNQTFSLQRRIERRTNIHQDQIQAVIDATGGASPTPTQQAIRRQSLQGLRGQLDRDLADLPAKVEQANRRIALHYFGTDAQGRDVLARVIWGTRTSLAVGFVSVAIAGLIGTALGAMAGYFGGWVDMLIMRVVEVVICFPRFVFLLIIIALFGRSLLMIMAVFGLLSWPGYTRQVRAQFLQLRQLDYAVAAEGLGLGKGRIMFRHLLPNGMTPVLVMATIGVAAGVLAEGGLSFLGLGDPNAPSWGELVNQARENFTIAGWLAWFPGAAMFLTVLAYNMVGDGLRDALDPKLRV